MYIQKKGPRLIHQTRTEYLYHTRFNTLDMAGIGHSGVHVRLEY